MLRRIVQLIAGVFFLTGLWLILVGVRGPGAQALLLGLIVLIAVRYERWRGRPAPPPEGPQWQPTGERFEDPGSGKTLEVHYNPTTGERRYQPDRGG